jgi:putative transposase
MREIANERLQFGYRRLLIILLPEGKGMNLEKVYRLRREERLKVRKRCGPQESLGHASADGDPAGTESAVVARHCA